MAITVTVIDDDSTQIPLLRHAMQAIGASATLEHVKQPSRWLAAIGNADTPAAGPTAGNTHLILLDINIPGEDSFALLGTLKQHPLLARIPVVIYSHYVDPELRDRAMAGGATAVAEKPDDLDGLSVLCRQLLDLAHSAPQPAA